jgi:ABC-type sugar transport system ATPase subunit
MRRDRSGPVDIGQRVVILDEATAHLDSTSFHSPRALLS